MTTCISTILHFVTAKKAQFKTVPLVVESDDTSLTLSACLDSLYEKLANVVKTVNFGKIRELKYYQSMTQDMKSEIKRMDALLDDDDDDAPQINILKKKKIKKSSNGEAAVEEDKKEL